MVFEGWNLHTEHGYMQRMMFPVCGMPGNYVGISKLPLEPPSGRSAIVRMGAMNSKFTYVELLTPV